MTPEHLKPVSYRVTCRCLRCNTVYTRTVRRRTAPDPPCPNKICRETAAVEERERMMANMRQIIEQERAPGIGGSIVGKAIDETARITMSDYGLSDLKDNVRVGETAVPKLPPHQQARVDNFFGPPKVQRNNPALAQQVSLLGARAMAGSFAPKQGSHIVDYALDPARGPALRPPIRIIAG